MTNNEFLKIREQLIQGKNECLQFVFDNYGSYCMSNLVFKNKCSRDEANDIFIDALLNLREKIISGKLKEIKNLKNYLYGTCMNMFRENLKMKKKIEAKQNELKKNLYSEDIQPDENVSESLINAEIAKKSLSSLGEKCQKILKLYYVFNLSMIEIADELGFSSKDVAKTTKSRCYKKWIEEAKLLIQLKQS